MERPKKVGATSSDYRYGQEALHALVIERILQTSESMKLRYAHKCHIEDTISLPFCQDELTRSLSFLYNKHIQNSIMIRHHKSLQESMVVAFEEKCSLKITPNYLSSIRSDPRRQADYIEAQAFKHLKQYYRNKKLIDGTKKELDRIDHPGNVCRVPKEELTEHFTKNLRFYEKIQETQLSCLDLIVKVPCVPVFLKTVNDAEVLAAINLLPSFKTAVSRVYVNKNKGKKKPEKPEFGKTTYRLFDEATNCFFEDPEFYLSMDVAIPVGRYHVREGLKALNDLFHDNNQNVAQELNSGKDSHKLYIYYMQRIAWRETETCLIKEDKLLYMLDCTRGDFREVQKKVMWDELKWLSEFVKQEKICEAMPQKKIELYTLGLESANYDSVQAGQNKIAKQVIYHVTEILLKNPKLHIVVSPIPAEYAHFYGAPKGEEASSEEQRPNTVYFEDNLSRPVQFLQRVNTREMDAKLGINSTDHAFAECTEKFVDMSLLSRLNAAVVESKETTGKRDEGEKKMVVPELKSTDETSDEDRIRQENLRRAAMRALNKFRHF